MANTFDPFGFRSFGRQEGGAPTAGFTKFALVSSDANLYFTGDPVAISSASIISSGGPGITLPVSGALEVTGIFAGCEYYSPSVARQVWSAYWPGNVTSSTPGYAYLITDPEQLFTVQGTTTAVLGTSAIGWNIGFTSSLQAAGNTTNGISNVALGTSTVGGATTLPFRIVDIYANWAPPGVNGTSSGTEGAQIMVVGFNNTNRKSLTGVST